MIEDNISIASAACVLLGASPLQSFDEETSEGEAARTFYDSVYGSLIKHRNWSFAKTKVKLQQLQKDADYGYKFVYRLPVGVVSIIALQDTRSDYKLVTREEIHTDIKNAFASVLLLPDESLLPEDFKLAFKYLLASAFAPIVTDDSAQAERYAKQGALFMKQASGNDAVQGPLKYITGSPLLDAYGS